MQIFFYLAAVIVGSILAYALAPKPPKQKAPTLADFDLPTAEEGRAIPWIFGTYKITDPNFIWYGDLEVRTKTKDGVKTRLYRMGTQQEFCISPVDALVALEYGGKDCGITEVTASGQISINLPNLFGGRDAEGGIDGDFDVCFGEPTQAVNDYLLAQLGAPLSAFRDSLTLVGRKPSWVANSTYIKPLLPTVRCITAGWEDGACWYPETAIVPDRELGSAEYDALVATVNDGAGLDYWWKLNTAFAADGDTEASVGNAGALAIKREAAQYYGYDTVIGGAEGLTCATGDDAAVQFTEYAETVNGALTVPYFLDGTESFTIGVWVQSDVALRYDVFGTNADGPSALYQGIWLTVNADGSLYLQWGDGLGNVHTNRQSFQSAPGIVGLTDRHFFVLAWDAIALTDKIKLYCDGERVALSYESGSGAAIGWDSTGTNPRIGFGARYTMIAGEDRLYGRLDEAFLHLGVMSAEDIAALYHAGTCNGGDGWDMNPAHIIYKALTSTDQGAGEPSATLDDANFRAAALTFYTEGCGLSFQWRNEGPIFDFVAEVCRHAGAVLTLDPSTGLTKLVPLRDGYNVDYLDVLTESDVIEVVEWQDAADGESVNEVTVEYRKRDGSKGTATWVNRASVQEQGVSHQTIAFPGITYHTLALRVAKRECMQRSSNLSRGKLKVNRNAWDKLPGEVFRFSHGAEGIDELVVRVIDIDLGTLTDGEITVTVMQDIFSLDDVLTDVADPGGGWTAPDTAPAAAIAQDVMEAPYWQLLGDLGAAETAAQAPGAGYVVPLIGKPTALSTEYNAWARISPNAYAETLTGAAFAPTATLTAALDRSADSDIDLTAPVDLDLVEPGWIVVIGTGTAAELCYVAVVDATLAEISILRARMDTTPQLHAAGTRVWFLDASALDWPRIPDEFAAADAVDVKAQTATGAGLLDITAATAASITLGSRQVRPYPPGNIEINGEAHPELLEGALTVTWAHRDRLVQGLTLVSQYDATDYGPEVGTTYNGLIYDDATDALIASSSGMTGTSWSPTVTSSGVLRLELEAARDGYASWQRQVRTFTFIADLARIVVSGDPRETAAGAIRDTTG